MAACSVSGVNVQRAVCAQPLKRKGVFVREFESGFNDKRFGICLLTFNR